MWEHGRRRSRERLGIKKTTPCQPYSFGAAAFVFTGCLLLSHRTRSHPDDSRFRPRSSESTTEAPRDGSSDRRASSIQDPALGGVVVMRKIQRGRQAGTHTHTTSNPREAVPTVQPTSRAPARCTSQHADEITTGSRRRRLSKY